MCAAVCGIKSIFLSFSIYRATYPAAHHRPFAHRAAAAESRRTAGAARHPCTVDAGVEAELRTSAVVAVAPHSHKAAVMAEAPHSRRAAVAVVALVLVPQSTQAWRRRTAAGHTRRAAVGLVGRLGMLAVR